MKQKIENVKLQTEANIKKFLSEFSSKAKSKIPQKEDEYQQNSHKGSQKTKLFLILIIILIGAGGFFLWETQEINKIKTPSAELIKK